MTQPPGRMLSRDATQVPCVGFSIEIRASDGTLLVHMSEKQGRLCVTGDRSRWDEGAIRFLDAMMQWSGQVGLPWKEEVRRAMEGMGR